MIRFLAEKTVIRMHDFLLRKDGGEPGLRDASLLDSALHQPMLAVQFSDETPSLFLLAATYAFHISENQPFFDGNKRAASSAMVLFLALNGIRLAASEDDLLEKIVAMANKKLDKHQLANWLSSIVRTLP